MNRTINFIASLTLMLAANSAHAIWPQDTTTFDGTGAAEMAQQENNQGLAAAKEAMLSDIRKISDAAGYSTYHDGIVMTQEYVKSRGTTDGVNRVLSKGELAKMKKTREANDKIVNDRLEELGNKLSVGHFSPDGYKKHFLCLKAWENLIAESRTSNYLRTISQSFKVIKDSKLDQKMWDEAYDLNAKSRDTKTYEKVQDACVGL